MVLLAWDQYDFFNEIDYPSNTTSNIENQEPAQLDIFSGEVSQVVKENKSKVNTTFSQIPRLQQVPIQESIPLSDEEFFINLQKKYNHLFKDVDYQEVEYDKKNSIIKFTTQGLEFKIEFQWKNVQYSVENTKFTVSDLWKFSANFSFLFINICQHFWFNSQDLHHVKKSNNISAKKAKELPEPQDRIFLTRTTIGKEKVDYLKYNGNIERNKASLHFKIWKEVYRVANISYTIHSKDPRDVESEIAISINNPNNLNIKKFDKNKWWLEVNSPEMINGLKDLSYHVLLNHNPHIV